jgi:hypothetical protein
VILAEPDLAGHDTSAEQNKINIVADWKTPRAEQRSAAQRRVYLDDHQTFVSIVTTTAPGSRSSLLGATCFFSTRQVALNSPLFAHLDNQYMRNTYHHYDQPLHTRAPRRENLQHLYDQPFSCSTVTLPAQILLWSAPTGRSTAQRQSLPACITCIRLTVVPPRIIPSQS